MIGSRTGLVDAPQDNETDAGMAELLGPEGMSNPFVAAVHATRMPMAVTNPRRPDNPLVFVNDAFVRLTGYARDEILGRNCRFLQGPGTDPRDIAAIHEAVAARVPIEREIRNLRKDGTAFWNRVLIAPVFSDTGILRFFFASQLDVTIEKDRLAALESDNAALVSELSERIRLAEEGEARLRFATTVGRLGIWELDLRSMALLTSATCREHFGHPAAVPLSLADLTDSLHGNDRAAFRAALLEQPPGEDVAQEFRVRGPDGVPRWVELRARPVQDRAGSHLVIAGTSAEITARKVSERRRQALLDLDDEFRRGGTDEALARTAAAILGTTLGVDRAGYCTVGPATAGAGLVEHWSAPGVPPLSDGWTSSGALAKALEAGRVLAASDAGEEGGVDAEAFRAAGARAGLGVPIVENGAPVALFFLADAAPRAWPADDRAFVQDIAGRTRMAIARRRAERDLQDLATSLEVQVAARSDELMETEAALRQSQKMEAVGQLTGGLAHDFNNLLTGISGSLEMLRRRVAAGRLDGLDRLLDAAEGSARRAASLTHRLLAFSRRQTLEPRPADIGGLAAGMEELISRTVGPGVVVTLAAEPAQWNTLVDHGQLENALLNLCINARDAMPDGGSLAIRTENRALDVAEARALELPPGDYVRLAVADTGTGMTPEVIAKAFDPFFTTKPIGQGTGLGLSMIYGFARQSGGQVRIESVPGEGTSVSLLLPRHLGAVPAAEAAGEGVAAGQDGAGESVLVIDDEPAVRMLLGTVLAEAGFSVLEAADGAAGLVILRSAARIDLLVTDVGLPGGFNGRQVADAARVLRPGLTVLFITGYAESAVLGGEALEAGMHVLPKPFALETLLRRVQGLLAAKRSP